ncbi:cell division protein FtsI [Paenibacillus flagellatus]|uniref:Cell division protein FtsI n=1 Tax=Paenibacillus flagellatus TaxID=2211139 RepID=A0A2V5K4C2_9BACL|nr:cell division protein FtsI [Paenibacillus flagellatus]
MKRKSEEKPEHVRRKHFAFRLNFFFFCTFLLFAILIVRLATLQIVNGAQYAEDEARNTMTPHAIPPIRGNIFDRTGYPLATSVSTQSLYYTAEPGEKKEEVIALAHRLAEAFRKYGDPAKPQPTAEETILAMDVGYGLDGNETKKPSYYSVPRRLKGDLTPEEIAFFSWSRDEFKGVDIQEESIRQYNEKTIAVQLVGYLKKFSAARNEESGLKFYRDKLKSTDPTEKYLDNEYVGFDGIELMYQEELRGKNGVKTYPTDVMGSIVGPVQLTRPDKGNNLFLTIDKDVQLATEEAIKSHLEYIRSPARDSWTYAPNAITGYAVAMEVDTGKVVAMASYPDYDPNRWYGGMNPDYYEANQYFIRNGTISEVRPPYADQKELNKHPTSLVYLGSTMKPLTVLIGLNEGLITANEVYDDTGIFYFGKDNKERLTNSDQKRNGPITAYQAIQYSSNTYMANIGNRLYFRQGMEGVELWDIYMEKFGLGVPTGSGLPGESPGFKDYLDTAKRYSPQAALVRATWGQLGKYTPLQLVQYTAMLANRGKRLKPQLVEKITTYDDQPVREFGPEVLNEEKFPDAYWNVLQKGMELVSAEGFRDVPYRVAIKTGTSTQSVAGKDIDNAVFIAYAPADKPKLAVAVVVPEGRFGGRGAAPIARQMFDAYDRAIGLYGTPNPNAQTKP